MIIPTQDSILINSPNDFRPAIECVHEIIESACQKYPQNIAVDDPEGTITYEELNRLSSILASRLQAANVEPEQIVPLIFHPSRWCAVAMLGVMKAGGAFVLLNHTHPRDVLSDICLQTRASLILASERNLPIADILANDVGKKLTILEVSENSIESMAKDVWARIPIKGCQNVSPQNLVYAVFTSGTTGRPKGIAAEHQAVASSIRGASASMHITSSVRVAQFASHSFDGAVYNYIFTLAAGGCVCIPHEDCLSRLTDELVRLRINWAALPPSVSRLANPREVPDLRVLAHAGEPIQQNDLDRWKYANSKVRVLGFYGPAEFVNSVTVKDFSQPPADPSSGKVKAVDLGYNPTATCWVVDYANPRRLISHGVGELVVGGPCLSRGYLNTSSDAFLEVIPSDWPHRDSLPHQVKKAYRTGDLVEIVYDSHGEQHLHFVGRKDRQFKIYGQLIRPNIIEDAIWRLVKSAIHVSVVNITLPNTKKQLLVAFVQLQRHFGRFLAEWDDAELIEASNALRKSLPKYMIPAFYRINEVPLTPNGKTDYTRLTQELVELMRTH